MTIDLEEIRARDRDYDDVFEAQANMSKDIAHRLVAWPVADRRAMLAAYDALRSRLVEADALLTEIAGHRPAVAFFAPQLAGVIGTLNRIDAFLAPDSADDDLTPRLCGY